MGEMLYCVYNKKSKDLDERFLFQGKSCYPLSPLAKTKENDFGSKSQKDQLNEIISKIGPLEDKDYGFIQNEVTR